LRGLSGGFFAGLRAGLRFAGFLAGLEAAFRFLGAFAGLRASLPLAGRLAGLVGLAGLAADLSGLGRLAGLAADLSGLVGLAGLAADLSGLGRLAGLVGLAGLAADLSGLGRLAGLVGLSGLVGLAPLRLAAFRLTGSLAWLSRLRGLLFRLEVLRLLSRVGSATRVTRLVSSPCLVAFLALVCTAAVLDFEGLRDKGGGFRVGLRVRFEIVGSAANDLRFGVSVCEMD